MDSQSSYDSMMVRMAREETRTTKSTTARGSTATDSQGAVVPRVPATRAWATRLVVVGIVLSALNLRPAITSLGALLEEVRDGLGMSGSVAGLLTSVPPLCFAVFGVMAPRLARRFGPGAVVCAGMVAIAAGLFIRPYAGDTVGTAGFLAASALALMGIAVSNVLMPVIVKRWFPDRVGSMTGLYSMAMALGTAAAAAVTVPMANVLGGSWQSGLAAWSVPAAAAVLPWIPHVRDRGTADPGVADPGAVDRGAADRDTADRGAVDRGAVDGDTADRGAVDRGAADRDTADRGAADRDTADRGAADGDTADRGAADRSGAPIGASRREGEAAREEPSAALRITRSRIAWALAVFFGLQATAAYITMGWMAQIFRDAGVAADTAGLLLAVIMVLGVPLAFVIPRVASRLPHQGPIVIALGVCGLAGYAGIYFAPAGGAWAWAVLLGVSNCAFPLALTMVGMRARTGAGVAQLSAFAQSTGYLISIPGPLLVGVLYQSSGGWGLPIALMTCLMIPQMVVGVLAGRDRTVEDEAAR
ncbi:MFS transporter [Streptomyces sp. NPDC050619]|uniref:MFS transporter n=1 Tax=Streptomyces sp. NPDC050619 TaxID=3157214 RepID=UPI0034154F41